jgi:hypothetical protein
VPELVARNGLDAIPVLDNLFVQFILCVAFDIIGIFTYLIPGLGELADIAWAPAQAGFIWSLVGGEKYGMSMVVLGFAEEVLPFTDIVPSCTIAWLLKVLSR